MLSAMDKPEPAPDPDDLFPLPREAVDRVLTDLERRARIAEIEAIADDPMPIEEALGSSVPNT